MLILYFSGTGNTKYVCEKFGSFFDGSQILSLENELWKKEIQNHQNIVFGHSVQFSNCPVHVREIIKENYQLFEHKNVYIIATMGLFSGDGAGCSARVFKKYGINIIGGLHIKMPDNIGDSKLLKKPIDVQRETIKKANKKIENAARKFKENKPTQDGLSVWHHLAGLFGQRLWFKKETQTYMDDVKISDKCTKCKICVNNCPLDNLSYSNGLIVASNKCTRCYRCVNNCPSEAITILGKSIVKQYKIKDLIE